MALALLTPCKIFVCVCVCVFEREICDSYVSLLSEVERKNVDST